jgi:predicted nucleic acid-binding protein
MTVKPGIVDANVLIYAINADAPQHQASRALLEAGRDPSVALFVTSQILCEFYAVCTNGRRISKSLSSADALRVIADLLTFLRVLPVPARAVAGWMDLLRRHPVTGGDVFDLQIVATMQANGMDRIYTFNTADFKVFPNWRSWLRRLWFASARRRGSIRWKRPPEASSRQGSIGLALFSGKVQVS